MSSTEPPAGSTPPPGEPTPPPGEPTPHRRPARDSGARRRRPTSRPGRRRRPRRRRPAPRPRLRAPRARPYGPGQPGNLLDRFLARLIDNIILAVVFGDHRRQSSVSIVYSRLPLDRRDLPVLPDQRSDQHGHRPGLLRLPGVEPRPDARQAGDEAAGPSARTARATRQWSRPSAATSTTPSLSSGSSRRRLVPLPDRSHRRLDPHRGRHQQRPEAPALVRQVRRWHPGHEERLTPHRRRR